MQYVSTAKSWLIDFTITPGRVIQFAKYTAVSAGSLVIDVTVFGILVWISVDLLGLHPTLGKLFAFGPTFVVVCLMRVAIVFAPSKPRAAVAA